MPWTRVIRIVGFAIALGVVCPTRAQVAIQGVPPRQRASSEVPSPIVSGRVTSGTTPPGQVGS